MACRQPRTGWAATGIIFLPAVRALRPTWGQYQGPSPKAVIFPESSHSTPDAPQAAPWANGPHWGRSGMSRCCQTEWPGSSSGQLSRFATTTRSADKSQESARVCVQTPSCADWRVDKLVEKIRGRFSGTLALRQAICSASCPAWARVPVKGKQSPVPVAHARHVLRPQCSRLPHSVYTRKGAFTHAFTDTFSLWHQPADQPGR